MSEEYKSSTIEKEAPRYYDIGALLSLIEGPNGEACRQIYADYKEVFESAPGSSGNHQLWPGGYVDHVTDAMNIGLRTYETYDALRPLPFSSSDVLLIVYLHDLEKPFKYSWNDGTLEKKPELAEKAASEAFKRDFIEKYGITLSPMQDNALEFVEGMRDHKYQKTRRVMGELAVLCHIADLTSARLWYNHPLAENDPWKGSARHNPEAHDIVMESEFNLA